jgi:hypothetical protein
VAGLIQHIQQPCLAPRNSPSRASALRKRKKTVQLLTERLRAMRAKLEFASDGAQVI